MVKNYMAYQNTFIYKIICKDDKITNTYVGLTIDFKKRQRSHELNCYNLKSGKLYDFIRLNGGWYNWDMIIVEKCFCQNRKEAGIREKYWYEMLKADLNKNYPSRNCDEWYHDNKDRLLVLQKKWRENFKVKKK
jgi:predicted GIY-YIG superfamily endonuclease